jgi:ABC-type lipoprotein release transport system permease subunit
LKLEFFLALKELKIYKTFFVIVIALSLGGGTYIYTTGLSEDMRDSTYSYSVRFNVGDMLIRPAEEKKFIENIDPKIRKITMLPGIAAVSQRLEAPIILIKGDKRESMTVMSFFPSKEIIVTELDNYIIKGDFLYDNSKGNVVIGDALSKDLNLDIGEKIELEFENGKREKYNIIGIMSAGRYTFDRNVIFLTFEEVEDVLEVKGTASRILIALKKDIVAEEYKPIIISMGIGERVNTAAEESLGMYTTLDLMSKIFRLMIISTLIVAAFMESVLFYIHVLSRIRYIGLLKAIGLTNNSIIKIYIIQGLIFGLIASVIGILLGFIATAYSQQNPFYLPVFNMTVFARFTAHAALESILFIITVAVLAIVYPAYKAIKTTISEAMRLG